MIKPESCNPCELVNISDGFSVSEGEGTAGVVILGEALGYNEYLDGLPFRPKAQSGSKLEEVFKIASRDLGQHVSRNNFLLYNVVNCHPPGDKLAGASYEKGAIECCSKNVDRVVGGFKTPFKKTVLALGNIPLKFLLGVSGIAEEKQSITHLRGFVYESRYGLVVPSLHPSGIKRGNNHHTPLLVEDLKRALKVANGSYTNYPTHKDYIAPVYQTTPGVDEAWSFYYKVKDSPKAVLTYDIETPMTGDIDEDERDDLEEADISLVQFSISRGTGIAMPFSSGYIPIITALLALPNVKANHNTWNFDNPRLRAKGIKIAGAIHDTMWMFKHWHPKLPRGLQSVASLFGFPFPWKHMYGSNLNWYGCADVDAVQWIIQALPPLMKARGVWEGYKDHIYRIHPILQRASDIGIPVNEEKRQALEIDFRKRRGALDKEIQKIIPDEIRNIKPKRKDKKTGEVDYGYIREPKIVRAEFDNYERMRDRLIGLNRNVVSFADYLYRKHSLTCAEFAGLDTSTGQRVTENRWCIVEPFKASKDQLVRYLKWKQKEVLVEAEGLVEERALQGGRNPELTARINELRDLADDYKVPKDLKSKKETTNKKELEEMFLKTGDPILEKVVSIRSYDTNLNNYLPNWKPAKDGSVHTTWGFTAPTGQFDARRPNVLNCSKHTEFGNEFRGIIEAPVGYTFLEFDFKSYHVATMGYCSNDRDYIRFSQLDPHSIFGSYIDPSILGGNIDLKWSDADIKVACKEFKKRCKEIGKKPHGVDVRQALAKPTVLGNQLELGAKKLQRQNRRFIHSVLEAERYQKILSDLFGKEEIYKRNIKEKAHIEKYLINEFGYIQYFYDVFNLSWNANKRCWYKKDGEGAREPIAFRVQGCAFGKIHLDLLELEEMRVNEEHRFVNSIHDSVIYMPEDKKVDRCIELVMSVLTKPCRYLVNEATGGEGLRVGVDYAVGKNWKGWHEMNNPGGMREV